jgi:hypothetical protein
LRSRILLFEQFAEELSAHFALSNARYRADGKSSSSNQLLTRTTAAGYDGSHYLASRNLKVILNL